MKVFGWRKVKCSMPLAGIATVDGQCLLRRARTVVVAIVVTGNIKNLVQKSQQYFYVVIFFYYIIILFSYFYSFPRDRRMSFEFEFNGWPHCTQAE